MNTPLVTFEQREKYLLVVGHGKRDCLADMAKASEGIYAKVLETQCRYMLVDYRQLEINVHFNEAFNIVKRYEKTQPLLKTLTIAAVFDARGAEFGRYWQNIAVQRGFTVEVFDDFESAEGWLLKCLSA